MPRSSRHKSSHKQHKHSTKDVRDHTESDDKESLKERRVREEPVLSSGIRVSRDSAAVEKKKTPSQSQQGNDVFGPGNGDLSSKKLIDRGDSSVSDRWNCGGEGRVEGRKEQKGEVFGPDSERGPKSKVSVESKSRSSKRIESFSERKDEGIESFSERKDKGSLLSAENEPKKGSVKVESKRRLEKDSKEKDSKGKEAYQYKDVKDKERGIERDKMVQEVTSERSVDDVTAAIGASESSRKEHAQMGDLEEVHVVKQEVEITERQIQDDSRNPELEKELEKRIKRRRDGSGDKDKWLEEVRDGDDRHLSSRDDTLKNGRYKDERKKDGRFEDERHKYREDLDRDHKCKDDRHRDERFSRDRAREKSESKHFRDESRPLESRHKKTKLQDSDCDGNERGTRYKDNRGSKKPSDDNEGHSVLKSRSTEQRTELGKNALSNRKLDSLAEKGRSESTTPTSSRLKRSPSSSPRVVKDQYRHGSKQAESACKEMSEERLQTNTSSTRELASAFVIPEKVSESCPMEKPKQKGVAHLGELTVENAPASQYERSPKAGHMSSPIQLTEKSPSSTSGDRRYLNRAGVRRSFDVEEMGRSDGSKDARDYNSSEDRGRDFPIEKPAVDEFSLAEPLDGESAPVGSSFTKSGLFSSSSPSLLPPPTPFRLGVDGPSILGSSEADNRGQVGDRRSNHRYKRNGAPSMGRGQGSAWKGTPNWPSLGNGFNPFQHGPPASGFHAVVQQFPAPVFGIRPSMELNHAGVSYPMHDADSFSNHIRPFGWRNPSDGSYAPQLQGWDGSNGVFGDESHTYGRPEWDQNRHLMSKQGWEMNDLWKGQNGTMNIEFPTPQKEEGYLARATADETWAGQSTHRTRDERNRPELLPAESIDIKRSDVITPSAKGTSEAPLKIVRERIPSPKPSKLPGHDDTARFCRVYLSKLDISVDLAHPKLYKQCMSLLEMDGDTTSDCHATNSTHTKETEVKMKISNDSLGASLFPSTTEAVYQRAMALYKKQNEEMRAKNPFPSFHGSEMENARQAPDNEKAGHVEDSLNLATRAASSPNKEEGKNSSTNLKSDLSVDAQEQLSDNNSGDVVFAYDSSEALMPESIECRVNLSRIHISPESTH
ncbi:uncharacterized protein LOC143860220 [Tasmannia lanceolata]|uniref:uncharacterized protein LOC143860220 n=1 Tax=Tasmannia lanceolata TaxID=3420 RepID=UPI004063946F